jgi:arginyl-tRNA--protein-N-Asp/Glu arginylyltransferase
MRGVISNCGACPYLPGREFHAFQPAPGEVPVGAYRSLMDQRFRRSGNHLYMPMCPGCQDCKPVRVAVHGFKPRRDQRRCAQANQDLVISFERRGLDAERSALFAAYKIGVHGTDDENGDSAHGFLVEDGGVTGGELHARDSAGRLLAVSVCDVFEDALSSVYCYYDPHSAARGLGTFMALSEIAYARQAGKRWLYLGFLVRGCGKMEYKARYRPQEVLEDGVWVLYP